MHIGHPIFIIFNGILKLILQRLLGRIFIFKSAEGYIKMSVIILIIAIICVQKIPRKHLEFEWDSMEDLAS